MTKRNTKRMSSEEEIDRRVVAEAENDTAWGKPARVRRAKSAALQIPGELAARVAFVAKLHRERSADAWITRVIEERVAFEETVFVRVKRELGTR